MTEPCADEAIILRTRPLRDVDLLVHVFSREHGKLTAVAPAARRSRKRFGGALEPGTWGNIRYVEKPSSDLVRLQDIVVRTRPPQLQLDMQLFAAQGIMLDVVDRMSMERQAAQDKFALIQQSLHALHEHPARDVLVHFLLAWLRLTGFRPQMAHCARCEAALQSESYHFAPADGGVLCGDCGRAQGWSLRVSESERQHWLTCAASATPLTAQTVAPFRVGLWQYILYVIDRPLASAAYWDMLWAV